MLTVRFASGHYFDEERAVLRFTAFHDHRIIPCTITLRTLCDKFGASADAPAAAFERQRYHIERLVEELIQEERFEADGSILICSPDCSWLHDASHRPIKERADRNGAACAPSVLDEPGIA